VAGTYRLKIQNLEACLLKDTQIVVQNKGALEFEELKVQPATCAQMNGSIQIQVSGQIGVTRFSLDGQKYTAQSSFTRLSAGTYRVYAQDSFCTISLNTNVLADTAKPFKISAIEPIPAECNAQNGQAKIIISGLNTNLSYRINSSTYTAPIASDLKVGRYMLTVENDQGCRDSMSFEITRTNCQVYLPNAFSPNADNINDKFILSASEGFIKTIKSYRIFDRWGNLIYSAPLGNIDFSTFNEWWDGSSPRGERLAQGTYIYSIEVELFPGFGKSFTVYKGEINLLH
jgi:gliding motility-associated-like protein